MEDFGYDHEHLVAEAGRTSDSLLKIKGTLIGAALAWTIVGASYVVLDLLEKAGYKTDMSFLFGSASLCWLCLTIYSRLVMRKRRERLDALGRRGIL